MGALCSATPVDLADLLDEVPGVNGACASIGVRSCGRKGAGMVATRRIAKGEKILRESPLLLLRGGHGEDLEERVRGLEAEDARVFWSLVDSQGGVDGKSADGILNSNTFRLTEDSIADRCGTPGHDDGQSERGLFRYASRFNHSCLPNISWSWRRGPQELVWLAAREIEPGEELEFSYATPVLSMPREARLRLLSDWRFQCRCEACSQWCGALAASDQRRRLMYLKRCAIGLCPMPFVGDNDVDQQVLDLRRISEEIARDPIKGVVEVLQLAMLQEMELRAYPQSLSRTYFRGYELARQGGDEGVAAEMASAAYEQVCLAEGDDAPRAQELRALLGQIPGAHATQLKLGG